MATHTITELIDDLDGSPADETLTFGVDDQTFEIDLNAANAEKLREALDPFLASARRLGLRPVVRSTSAAPRVRKVTHLPDVRPGYSVQERRSMQKWAKANGLKPPADRGRIAATVSSGWEADGRPL